MKRTALLVAAILLLAAPTFAQRYISGLIWPEPAVITPGDNGAPPSDAIVLFNGKNFDAWNGVGKTTIDDDGGFIS